MLSQNKIINKYNLISIFILIVYFIGYSHIGFSLDDGGYLYGAGWRLIIGQEMYIDYIYARPPLSPIISWFLQWTLDDYQEYLKIRYFFYAEMFLTSYFIAKSINIFSKFEDKYPIFFISTLFFVINVHFNNYLWHTTDGLFFSSLSFYLILKRKIFFASLFLLFALLTKQSFYPLFFIYPLFIFLYFNKDKDILIRFILSLFVNISLMFLIFIVFFNSELFAFFNLRQEHSQVGPFIKAGFIVYIVHFLFFTSLNTILFFFSEENRNMLLNYSNKFTRAVLLKKFIDFIYISTFIILLTSLIMLIFVDTPSAKIYHMIISYILVILFLEELYKLYKKRDYKRFSFIITVIMISWCSSLSWGYMTPAFFIAPVAFLYFLNHKSLIDHKIVFLIVVFFIIDTPIVLSERTVYQKDLGFFSKKLEGIYTTKEKYNQIKKINLKIEKCEKENKTWAVFPDYTSAKYAKNSYPSLSLDWVSNVEAMNKYEKVEKQIKNIDCLILNHDYRFKNKKELFDWKDKPNGY